MKKIKWKILLITSAVCLLPIIAGIYLWDKLPDVMPIHFDFNNNPDNFAPKSVAVIFLPCFMAALQMFCCVVSDYNKNKHGGNTNVEVVYKWITPILTIFIQVMVFAVSLGKSVDIKRYVLLFLGIVFIISGCCMPKLTYVKHYNISKENAKKINKFLGAETVVLGFLAILAALLPGKVAIYWLVLVIPYIISGTIYSIFVCRKNK